MQVQSIPLSQAVVRLDGQYGNGAIVADLARLAYVMRGKDYDLLDLETVQARLAQLPDQQITRPETGTCRALFDFPDLALSPTGPRTRVIVAARPATDSPVKVGTIRSESVYELFYTALPPGAFTPADVVALYLHRGAFETVLADEDREVLLVSGDTRSYARRLYQDGQKKQPGRCGRVTSIRGGRGRE